MKIDLNDSASVIVLAELAAKQGYISGTNWMKDCTFKDMEFVRARLNASSFESLQDLFFEIADLKKMLETARRRKTEQA